MKIKQKRVGKVLRLFAAILLLNIALLPPSPAYAQSSAASMYLSPASGEIAEGETLTVQLLEDSGEEQANVVKANLTYAPEQLEFAGVDDSDSGFNIPVKATGENGNIEIIRGAVPAVYGEQLIIKINFKVKMQHGTTSINIAEDSQIVRPAAPDSPPKNILSTSRGGTYAIKPTPPPPVPAPTAALSPPPASPVSRQRPAPVLTQVAADEDKVSLALATPSGERREKQSQLSFWIPVFILALTLIASIGIGSDTRKIKNFRNQMFQLNHQLSARLNSARLNLKKHFS